MGIAFTLKSGDGLFQEAVTCEFGVAEWAQLREFYANAEQLRSTRFVQNRHGGSVSVTWRAGLGATSRSKEIETDDVWAMLLKLRPFVLQKESCNFLRTRKLLTRRINHRAIRAHLDEVRRIFELELLRNVVGIRGPGRNPLSVEVVMDWLNAFEYHKDQGKRTAVARDLGIFGTDRDGLPLVLVSLVEIIKAVLALSDFVEALFEVKAGDRNEMHCSPKYFARTAGD